MRLASLSVLCFVALAACGSEPADHIDRRTPDEIALAAVTARLDGDRALEYSLSTPADRAVRDSAAFVRDAPNTNSGIFRAARAKSSTEVASSEVGDSTAVVTMSTTVVDAEAIGQDLMAEMMAGGMSEMSGRSDEENEAMAESAFQRAMDGDPPLVTNEERIELALTPDGWRVVRHWDYASNLGLTDVRVSRPDDPYGIGLAPTVDGTLTNHGDIELSSVSLKVYYLTNAGTTVAESSESVVNEYLGGPLKPGYIREFSAMVGEDIPDFDSVRVEVDDFVLAAR